MKKIKNKKKQTENVNVADLIAAAGTYLYVTAMLVVFPMFYRENLLHLIQDKKNFFLFFSLLYLLCLIPAAAGWAVNCLTRRKKAQWTADLVFAVLLLAAIVISTVTALDRKAAWNGMSYRTVAADVFLLCTILYFALRRYGKCSRYVIWCHLAGSAAVYLTGILCACKINFLYMQDGLALPEIFLTPLGNTNFNACYVCLVLPFVLVLYMVSKDAFSRRVCGTVLYLGFLFSMFIKTESSVLTVLASLLILCGFAVEKQEWLERFAQILLLWIAANTTIWILTVFFKDHLYPFDGVGAMLISGRVLAVLWILAGLCYLLVRKWGGARLQTTLLSLRKPLGMVLAVTIGLTALAAVLSNTVFRQQAENSICSFLVLKDESFSKRGMVWMKTVELLKRSSLKEIFLGHGLNCFGASIKPFCYDEVVREYGFLIKDPHNEFLQVLTDMGILGALGYFGLLFSTLISSLRKWKNVRNNSDYADSELQIASVLTVSAYLIQGLVNGYALTHLPLLFIFLGIFNAETHAETKGKKDFSF